MVNLLITMRCNRQCTYCFAKEKIHSYLRSNLSTDITIPDLDRVLDFLTGSGCSALQLAGGEPTLHPRFDEILIRTLRRDMYVNLLSNALWDSEKNELFAKIPPTSLGFLLNIDHPDSYSQKEWRRIEDNLSVTRLQANATLSFNIFESEPRCEYIFELLSKYDFNKLRLSFSMPVVFGETKNVYLPIKEYSTVTPFVMDFVRRAESMGATVKMDNTVPICMFSEGELGELLLKGVLDPRRNFVCFPAVDIGPDLSVWRCFGTSGLSNRSLEDFNSLHEVYEYYERNFKPYQVEVFPMDECYECEHARKGVCQGGCMGFSISRCMEMGNCPQEIADKNILDMRLRLPDSLTIGMYEIPKETLTLTLGSRTVMEVHPAMKNLLDLFDGKRTAREALEMYLRTNGPVGEAGDVLDVFLTDIASEQLIPTIRRLLDREFLIYDRSNPYGGKEMVDSSADEIDVIG